MSRDTVVLTASAGSLTGLSEILRELSIELEVRPLLSFEPPADWGPLDAAIARRGNYAAVALTSPRAAEAMAERIEASRTSWEKTGPEVWVSGPATAEGLRGKAGPVRKPDAPARPHASAAAALARTMVDARVGSPVLFPCGDRRRDELPVMLRSHGIQVDEVVCYRSVLATPQEARAAAAAGNLLIVASPSVATLLAETCPAASRPRLVAIGTATAEAALAGGWSPAAIAAQPSAPAVAAAVSGVLAPR
jgi:uroporphyrinogen-III synthase